MLVDLMVENYAVIEKLRVHFHRGLNVLTGETGSGKSIVVDAMGLLFGGRSAAEMLRSGSSRARIAGRFEAPASVLPILENAGIELEDGELLIEREILAGGKSRAFVGNRPATAALLRELAPHLGDIHGQHDQQQLFYPHVQLEMLDVFAGAGAQAAEVQALFRQWHSCAAELADLAQGDQEKLRLLDLWTFQRQEIESAALQAGEEEALEAERRVLQNVNKLLEIANQAYAALYEDPESAYAQLRTSGKRIEDLTRIDESLAAVNESVRAASIAVDEASSELRHYLSKLEADPQRLEEVEARLAAIGKLKRKYGLTIDEILAFLVEIQLRIASVEQAGDRRATLEKQHKELAARFDAQAEVLSARRKGSALELGARIASELRDLAMGRSVVEIRVSPLDRSPTGIDQVSFLVSPNAGEEPRPMEKVLSGGELSRFALALKTCLAVDQIPGGEAPLHTLVFDEVDAGIGGNAAESVGRRLKRLAARNQVLCVTHLAQIAGFADHHYAVEKLESKGRTMATIAELSGDARTREIGRMLSGQHLTPEALKHAEQLIQRA